VQGIGIKSQERAPDITALLGVLMEKLEKDKKTLQVVLGVGLYWAWVWGCGEGCCGDGHGGKGHCGDLRCNT